MLAGNCSFKLENSAVIVAKFYCPHAVADADGCIKVRDASILLNSVASNVSISQNRLVIE